MRKKKLRFKYLQAVVWDPKGGNVYGMHPLFNETVVYWLGMIPNVPGHCAVATPSGKVVTMVHPEDFRKAKDAEL